MKGNFCFEFVRRGKRSVVVVVVVGIDQWWQRRYSGRPRPETPSLSGQRPPLHPLRLPQSFPTRRTYRTWSSIIWKWSLAKHRELALLESIIIAWVSIDFFFKSFFWNRSNIFVHRLFSRNEKSIEEQEVASQFSNATSQLINSSCDFFLSFLNLLESLEKRKLCNTENFPSTQTSQEVIEMKKEKSPASSTDKERKDLVSKLSRLSIDNNVFEGSTDLPQVFQVYIYFTMFIHAHSRSSRVTLHQA